MILRRNDFCQKQKIGACSVTGRFAASSQASRKYGYITLSGGITNQKAILKKYAEDNGFHNTIFYDDA